jgi:acetyl esterase/lipase
MALDPRVQRLLQLVAASHPRAAPSTSVAERRAGLEALMKLGGPAPPIGRVEEQSLPGPAGPLRARVYTPVDHGEGDLPGLAYFHGGGQVAGSLDTHDSIARDLANAGRCRIVAIGYRLAPEHRFPAAVDDARFAAAYIASHAPEFGIDAGRFGICGDSAGATLAAAACRALAETQRIALQVLLCPILDYARSTPSWQEFGSGYLIDAATLAYDLDHYLPRAVDAADERVSPLRAPSLCGMPPTLIHTAEYDPLRDEGREYFERLIREGCEATYTCHPGMIHFFYGLKAVIPSAGRALAAIGQEIQGAFTRGAASPVRAANVGQAWESGA